jgi:hypothetical protein
MSRNQFLCARAATFPPLFVFTLADDDTVVVASCLTRVCEWEVMLQFNPV